MSDYRSKIITNAMVPRLDPTPNRHLGPVIEVDTLEQAVREAAGEFDLCGNGVAEFLSWFGIASRHTVRVAIPDIFIHVESTQGGDVEFDDNAFDTFVEEKLVELIEDEGYVVTDGPNCTSDVASERES